MIVESPHNSRVLLTAELKKLSNYLQAWSKVNLKDDQMLSFIVTDFSSPDKAKYLNIEKDCKVEGSKGRHLINCLK